jgi:AraC-like DNA-binding protein
MQPDQNRLSHAFVSAQDAVEFNRQMSSAGWNLEFLSLEQAPSRLTVEAAQSQDLIIQKAYFAGRLRQLGVAPAGFITVGMALDRVDGLVFGNRGCTSNDLMSFTTNVGLDAITERGYRAFTISVRENRVEEYIESQQMSGIDLRGFSSRSVSTTLPEFHKALRITLTEALGSARSGAPRERFDSDFDITGQLLEAWSAQNSITRYQYAASSRRRNKVIEYINANLSEPLSIDSISRECAIGRKTLERDFKSHFGLSPKRYINLKRLSAVRKDLLSTTGGPNIQAIATTWGFNHMSKFAADYRQVFGELPSVTQASMG